MNDCTNKNQSRHFQYKTCLFCNKNIQSITIISSFRYAETGLKGQKTRIQLPKYKTQFSTSSEEKKNIVISTGEKKNQHFHHKTRELSKTFEHKYFHFLKTYQVTPSLAKTRFFAKKVYKNSLIIPMLNRINPTSHIDTEFLKTYYNIVLQSRSRSS